MLLYLLYIILMPSYHGDARESQFRAKYPFIDRPARIEPTKIVREKRALVLLVDFPDKPHTHNAEEFQTILFDRIPGSMWHYYNEVSYSKFSLDGYVYGWLRVPHYYSYYCNGDDSTGTDDDYGFDFDNFPHNVLGLVRDAVQTADYYINFQEFDTDGDSFVDALFIVHSGPGAEATQNASHIWSHKCSFSDVHEIYPSSPEYIPVDGVKVNVYSMEPEELDENHTMITTGVFCHEFGHVLGLPDLYDTDYSSLGIDMFCMMSGGSWLGSPPGSCPAHFCAWCKYALGWVEPVALERDKVKKIEDASIPAVENEDVIYRFLENPGGVSDWMIGSGEGEYFLVENRERTGYDSYLPGGGLLILHIDEQKRTNDDDSHPLVGVMQADGDLSPVFSLLNGASSDDLWKDDTTGFSNISYPSSYFYDGRPSGVEVSNISPSGDVMRADLELLPVFLDRLYTFPNPFVKEEAGDGVFFSYLPCLDEETENMFPDFYVRIFDIRGRAIRRLSAKEDGDTYLRRIYWDGRNDRGDEIASGLYYYLMEIPERGEKNRGKLTLVH